MLSHLLSHEEIVEAQHALLATMRREFPDDVHRNIAFPGGGRPNSEIWTNGHYWYHHRFIDESIARTPRFLNWFGIEKPAPLRIAVEINVVPEGRNGQVKGFFARDDATKGLYLMHTADIAGGVRGVSGRIFRAWHGEPRIEVYDPEGTVRRGFIALPINAASPTRPLIRYIEKVTEFRRWVADNNFADWVAAGNVVDEHLAVEPLLQAHTRLLQRASGQAHELSSRRNRHSCHGEIVDALHSWRKNLRLPRNHRIVKNVFIDMGVENAHGQLVELYEVKSSAARSNVYSAIGQLMSHGPTNCSKIVVHG